VPGIRQIIADMPRLARHLRETVTLEHAGDWRQQERADTINTLILSFVSKLDDDNVPYGRSHEEG